MAIAISKISERPKLRGYSALIGYPIYPSTMIRYVEHKEYMVYIDTEYLFTKVPNGKIQMWCSVEDFKTTYPKKWQEIQAELALQRLKSS